jgi:hypothetical protein
MDMTHNSRSYERDLESLAMCYDVEPPITWERVHEAVNANVAGWDSKTNAEDRLRLAELKGN